MLIVLMLVFIIALSECLFLNSFNCRVCVSFFIIYYPFLVLVLFCFYNLVPLCTCFHSFAWLELISHRSFMPKMLTGNGQKGWPYIQRLLVDLFQFMEPFLRHAELGDPVCLYL